MRGAQTNEQNNYTHFPPMSAVCQTVLPPAAVERAAPYYALTVDQISETAVSKNERCGKPQ